MSPTARHTPPAPAPQETSDRRELLVARRAEALDDAQRAFLRTVSHELRTPLNAIIGFSEIIAEELYGPLGAPQYREYAEHVRQSGHRLLKLVNQVLEIARLQGKVMDLEVRAEALDHAFDDVRDQLRQDLDARRVAIRIENDGALPAVCADPRGLRTLLQNVLQNAILYGPADETVEISARQRGDRVDIRIEDHGPGIDGADIPRLLSPFEQGDNSLTRSNEGAGLGLPIARLLAETMGGHLRLTSPEGHGLCVCITLPAA
ncbi:MAG: HAMP domain-containing sensor histidine kinase [Pseudomonadota bacterium]